MASNSKSFFDSFSGRIGNVVVYAMNGKTVIRALPAKRKRKPTENQLKSRNAFTHILKIMQKAKPVVKIGFAHVAQNRTAFQEAMSVNLNAYKHAYVKENLDTWLKVSGGNRAGFEDLSLQLITGGIEISWAYNENEAPLLKKDNVVVLAMEQHGEDAYYSFAAAQRFNEKCTLKITTQPTSKTYHVFIFAVAAMADIRQNPALVSNSQWVGTISV